MTQSALISCPTGLTPPHPWTLLPFPPFPGGTCAQHSYHSGFYEALSCGISPVPTLTYRLRAEDPFSAKTVASNSCLGTLPLYSPAYLSKQGVTLLAGRVGPRALESVRPPIQSPLCHLRAVPPEAGDTITQTCSDMCELGNSVVNHMLAKPEVRFYY